MGKRIDKYFIYPLFFYDNQSWIVPWFRCVEYR